MKLREPKQIEALIHPRDGGRLKPAVAQLLSETGAILEGHFRLQSGLHSPYFARVGQLLYRPVDADALASFMIPQLATYQSMENLVCLASDNASGYLGRAIAKALRARLAVASHSAAGFMESAVIVFPFNGPRLARADRNSTTLDLGGSRFDSADHR